MATAEICRDDKSDAEWLNNEAALDKNKEETRKNTEKE